MARLKRIYFNSICSDDATSCWSYALNKIAYISTLRSENKDLTTDCKMHLTAVKEYKGRVKTLKR